MNKSTVVIFISLLITFCSCTSKKENTYKEWLKESVFFQIYMPSYADSNGDGYGDFMGLTAKLDYIENMGIKYIWLTPFLESPKVDKGYDVLDYDAVDPTYGLLDDF